MNTDNLAISVINPAEIARNNCAKADTYTARYIRYKFTKLSADKGIGRWLLAIYHNPGRTKNELFKVIFGDKPHSAFAETFTVMRGSELIYNKKGYYITDLGINLLKQFKLL